MLTLNEAIERVRTAAPPGVTNPVMIDLYRSMGLMMLLHVDIEALETIFLARRCAGDGAQAVLDLEVVE